MRSCRADGSVAGAQIAINSAAACHAARYTDPVSQKTPLPVSLYLHVPFCTVKCAYCDFNSYAGMEDSIPSWEAALRDELRRWSSHVAGRPVPTVFIGGGTPSLLPSESIDRIMQTIHELFLLSPDAEVTMEANPESVSLDRLRAYRESGVNRLSLGVQSLDAAELVFLDRIHSADRAEEAFGAARQAGFDNVSLDLIFDLPGQSSPSWERTLERVIAWQPDHLSCYSLIVEEGTPLALQVAARRVAEPDPDLVAELAAETEQRLGANNFEQYEISNYAREDTDGGKECRHNLVYWTHGEYIGAGPGAHGFVDGIRYSVERSPLRYARLLSGPDGQHGLPTPAAVSAEQITPEIAALDTFIMGMRLNAGIDTETFARRYPTAWDGFQEALAWGQRESLIVRAQGRLRLTTRGRRLANELFVRIMEPSLV